MKILSKNLKEGKFKLRITNLDDLWYLSQIVEEGDIVKGKTTRKIKIGDKSVKKTYFLEIKVEKEEYSESTLRISGIITQGPEEVELGAHQSFSLQEGDEFTIIKESWSKPNLDRLRDAEKEKSDILICSLDRDSAAVAILKAKGCEVISRLKGDVEKKSYKSEVKDFFMEVVQNLKDNSERYKATKVIIASPPIWHSKIQEKIDSDFRKKCIIIESSGGENAIDEILKSDAISNIIKEDRTTREIKLVEEVLKEIATTGKVEYGFKEVKKVAETGAIEIFLVTDKYLKKAREEGKYLELEDLMKGIEKMQGDIYIISTNHEGGKKLDGLGGVAALLRYKL